MLNLSRRTLGPALLAVCAVIVLSASVRAATSAPVQILTQMRTPIVWQGFGTWLVMTEDMPTGRTCYYFDYLTRSKVILKKPQPGTYAPLGSAIKWLMYIDKIDGLNRLIAHDVDHQIFHIAKSSPMNQVGCGFVGSDCIYGQYRAAWVKDHYPVDIFRLHLTNGVYETVCISDSEKSDFAHDGNLMVYRAHYGPGDNRICGLYFSGGGEFVIANRDAIHPTVCGQLVAWAEPNGTGFNIMAEDISTGEMRTVGYTKANPPSPEAGMGAIFWEDARNKATGLDIYGYDWGTKREFAVTNAAGDQVRLRVCNDMVTYVSGAKNYEVLWGAKIERLVRRSTQ